MSDAALIDAFVGQFTKGEPLRLFREFSLPEGVTPEDVAPLLTEPWNEDGVATWRSKRIETPVSALQILYKVVPGPLPTLYEQLILTYQWAEVDLDTFRLLPNYPPSLSGLAKTITADSVMFRVLSSHGFVQFGKGPDVNYDPVCFDLNERSPDGDCAIVRLDHEEILIRERIRIVAKVADSFRQLVLLAIGDTGTHRKPHHKTGI
jgi:hypothetical protein